MGKLKKKNWTSFYISHECGIKNFLKLPINKCLKDICVTGPFKIIYIFIIILPKIYFNSLILLSNRVKKLYK